MVLLTRNGLPVYILAILVLTSCQGAVSKKQAHYSAETPEEVIKLWKKGSSAGYRLKIVHDHRAVLFSVSESEAVILERLGPPDWTDTKPHPGIGLEPPVAKEHWYFLNDPPLGELVKTLQLRFDSSLKLRYWHIGSWRRVGPNRLMMD